MMISGLNIGYPNICKSWQGEGPYAGQRIVVLRFNGCNFKCHWNTADGGKAWCDTKKTWDGSEKGETWEVDELVSAVWHESHRRLPQAEWEPKRLFGSYKYADIVMVTGGEPMLRQTSAPFQKVIEGLRAKGLDIHIETNGSRPPLEWARKNIDFFDMSPKYQLREYEEDYTKEKMRAWQDCGVQVAWKFVVGTQQDVYDLRDWLLKMDISKDADIWLMPLTNDDKTHKDSDDILRGGIIQAFTESYLGFKHVRISPRLQIDGNFP
jgi:7-carboxy-7-deazaguanine synthase